MKEASVKTLEKDKFDNNSTDKAAAGKTGVRPDTRQIVTIGMMAAILSVLSVIPIPFSVFGVPMTLQTFAVALVGYTIGAVPGAVTALIYLLLGLLGVPVYNGAQAGPGVLFGLAGGFIFGFIPMAFLCGYGSRVRMSDKWMKVFPAVGLGITGLAVCHLTGVFQFMLVYNSMNAGSEGFVAAGMAKAFALVSAPYIPKDILSVVLAYMASRALKRALNRSGLMEN
ncbi:MAG: biotin transporter BioY [Lachnospiraceae bacterium]|nr:biotin transporter BioY [Lachnospiraceae bacterium]